MIAGVILAAGFSRRMPKNKLHLPLGKKQLFMYSVDLAARFPFTQRIIVTNDQEIARYAQAKGIEWVQSPHAIQGMGNSVAQGAKAIVKPTKGVIFLNADQPFLTEKQLHKMVKYFLQVEGIVVPKILGKPCSPCIFSSEYLHLLCNLQGEQGGRAIYQKYPQSVHWLEQEEGHCFQDIDDWETYQKYCTE